MPHRLPDVAIFWDYENCPAPASASGWGIVKEIRHAAQVYGSIKVFRAYLELPEHATSPESRSFQLRSELQASGVSLTDCPHNGRKDVADKMILVDMMAHAIDNPAPWTYILISGDRDFAYAISVLGLRGYQVVLLSPSTAHISLRSQATTCVNWSDILGRLTAASSRKPTRRQDSPPTPLPVPTVTNVPPAPMGHEKDLSVSDNDSHKPNSDNVDLFNYLRACRRRRQSSISSDISQSTTFSESQNDTTTHTGYFSASEVPVFSPPLAPLGRSHRADSTSTHASVDSISRPTTTSDPSPAVSHPNPHSASVSQAAAKTTSQPVSHTQSPQVSSPKPAPYAHPPTLPDPKPPVPSIFKPLVKLLREHLAAGSRYPSRETLAHILNQNPFLYSMAKVERFGQYIALAERHRIVTQGPGGIVLRPEWS